MSIVKILVTTDGSNLSAKAVDAAVELARQFDGELIGMTTVVASVPAGAFDEEDQTIKDRLDAVARKAAEKNVPCSVVAEHSDSVSKGILDCAAKNGVSFIVMSSRGLGTFGAFLLGSETQKVLSQADRPVLVVR